jgi:mannose-1-phosphate guanylyltransferase
VISALILSAGLGTRLDPLTRIVAKPAMPVADSTLIEHVIGWLARHGVRDVVINLHHRPETITAITGDGTHLGVALRYSWEETVLGSAGGPRHALPLLGSDPVLIVNGDTLAEIDLPEMLRAHQDTGADVTMAVAPHPAPAKYGGVRLDDSGRVTGFVPKGTPGESWHFVGVQLAHRRLFADLRDGDRQESVGGLYRDWIARSPGAIRGWPTIVDAVDIGTPRDYLAAAIRLRQGREASSARTSRSIVWPDSTVDPDARLDDCIVAGGAHVPAGLRATASILIPADLARPGDRATIRDGLAIFAIE